MQKRESGCPLCGAKLTAVQLLDGGLEVVDLEQGVIGARCPYCQGYLEVRPVADKLELGYLVGKGSAPRRFDVAMSLPLDGLTVTRREEGLTLTVPGRTWQFVE